ncbi:MAG: Gfo/Idh/MocA family protein [Desulfovibrio sp.]
MKALFLGLGGVGQRHLRNLLQIQPDVELGAIRHGDRAFEIGYDLQPDYDVDIMEKYNITRLSSMDEAIDWWPDYAVISSPTSKHMEQATALVKAGIPVFVEKPISHSLEGVAELIDIAEDMDVPVMIGYMFRFHPGVKRFMKLVKQQAAGPILSGHIQLHSFMPAWHSYEKHDEFYAGRKDLGGGAVLSEIHEIDLLAAMLGLPEQLLACGGSLSSLNMDVEDTASAILSYRHENKALPVTLNMCFVQRPPARIITFYCENGYIRWSGMDSIVELVDEANGKHEREDFSSFDRNEMFIAELRHFVQCIQNGKKPMSSLDETSVGHQLAMGIKHSMETGEAVLMADPESE